MPCPASCALFQNTAQHPAQCLSFWLPGEQAIGKRTHAATWNAPVSRQENASSVTATRSCKNALPSILSVIQEYDSTSCAVPVFLAAWRAGDRKTHPYRDRKCIQCDCDQELQKCLARHPERYPGIQLNIRSSDSQNCLNFSIHFQNNKNFFILVFFLKRSFYHSCSDIASQDLYRLLF